MCNTPNGVYRACALDTGARTDVAQFDIWDDASEIVHATTFEATSGSFDSMGIIPAELMHSLAGPPSAKVPRRPLCLKPGVGKARSRKYLTSDRTEGDLSTALTVVHPRRVGSLGPSGC